MDDWTAVPERARMSPGVLVARCPISRAASRARAAFRSRGAPASRPPRRVPSPPSPRGARVGVVVVASMATSSSSSSTAAHASRRVAKVAVVGAGAAGLAAAKELREFGHDVRVFEKGRDVGGVWVYDAAVEDDALGVDPNRAIVHSSVYASLRTNLPREVMGYASFPFASSKSFSGSDDRRFCGHEEVRAYLRAYATRHDLLDAISLGEEVTDATPVVAKASDDDDATRWGPKWRVTTRSVEKGDDDDANAAVVETFDALVVCNGHYSVPRVPSLPGSEARPPRTDWSPYDRVRVVHAVP